MKERYLEELKMLLGKYSISQEELDDILADYGEMIDDAISENMSDEKIIDLIGTPSKVVEDLVEGLEEVNEEGVEYEYPMRHHVKTKHQKHKDNKIIALMPFISTIVFFILGFGFELWHPGWMVFLAIPVTAIVINAFEKRKNQGLVALSPFIAIVAFFVLGFGFSLWHPGWLVFLIIPVLGIFSGQKKTKLLPLLTALSPFVAITIFILYGYFAEQWNQIWMVFLIIPVLGGLNYDKPWKIVVFEGSLVLAVAAYLYLGYTYDEWTYSLFAFLIPIGASIITSDDNFLVIKRKNYVEWLWFLGCLVIYIGAGLIFKTTWAYLWMIFLTLPVYSILKHADKESKLVAVMPFISTVIFFSLGFFWGFWAFAWIAYLLIPMVAIIKNA
jgi:uncharacterized membrane protein